METFEMIGYYILYIFVPLSIVTYLVIVLLEIRAERKRWNKGINAITGWNWKLQNPERFGGYYFFKDGLGIAEFFKYDCVVKVNSNFLTKEIF